MVEDEVPVGDEESTNPAPTSVMTRCSSPTVSKASGIRSKSATATTIPPDSAIAVCNSRWRRSARAPPASVATTVRPAKGIAIQVTEGERTLREEANRR